MTEGRRSHPELAEALRERGVAAPAAAAVLRHFTSAGLVTGGHADSVDSATKSDPRPVGSAYELPPGTARPTGRKIRQPPTGAPAEPLRSIGAAPIDDDDEADQPKRRGKKADRRKRSELDKPVDETPEDAEQRARSICLGLLASRARTRGELAEAMRQREVPESTATAVLARFAEVGLIDDASFAQEWVESRRRGRGLARRAIAMELRRKGLAAAEWLSRRWRPLTRVTRWPRRPSWCVSGCGACAPWRPR
ncbi:regulatory protein RecX [Fodinicola feengrottensis]|uniref:regulatory protein RecX n=1 Tax=Fodinicola feengrottensis TaxID=435914 RepID=UPI0024422165|nr:regulatory protein RecX [Fodinicola feengrottensis]